MSSEVERMDYRDKIIVNVRDMMASSDKRGRLMFGIRYDIDGAWDSFNGVYPDNIDAELQFMEDFSASICKDKSKIVLCYGPFDN